MQQQALKAFRSGRLLKPAAGQLLVMAHMTHLDHVMRQVLLL
jgi:hypothetical protein